MEDYLVAKDFLDYLKIKIPPKAPEGKMKTFFIKLIHGELGYKKDLEKYHVKYLNEIVDLARTKSYHADKLLFKLHSVQAVWVLPFCKVRYRSLCFAPLR